MLRECLSSPVRNAARVDIERCENRRRFVVDVVLISFPTSFLTGLDYWDPPLLGKFGVGVLFAKVLHT